MLKEPSATSREGAPSLNGDGLFRSAPLPMCVCDLETARFLDANDMLAEMAGYSVHELLAGPKVNDLLIGGEGEDVAEILKGNSAEIRRRNAWKFVGRSGIAQEVRLHSRKIEFSGRSAALVTIVDITEQLRSERQNTALYRISELSRKGGNIDSFFVSLHSLLSEFLPAKNMFIALINGDTNTVTFPYFIDEFDLPPKQGPPAGLTGVVLKTGNPLHLAATDRRELAGKVASVGTPAADWLGVPLKRGEETFGAIVVQSYDRQTVLGEKEKGVLNYVSQHVANALDFKYAQEALRASEERYALAARGANDGLWDWDITRNYVYVSPRWRQMLGYDEQLRFSDMWDYFALVHPEDVEAVKEALDAHLDGLTAHFQSVHRMRYKDSSYRWVLARGIAIRDEHGKATRIAGSQTDITEQRIAEEQLQHDAFHDGLTGLPNRALLLDRLMGCINRSSRKKEYRYAVLFLDVDRFKVLNDSLGHLAGDELLLIISRRLQKEIRPGDTVARFAGDEFTVLLDDIADDVDALQIAQRLQGEIMQPVIIENREIYATISIGIVIGDTAYTRPEDLLRDADTALYQAKASGKSCIKMFGRTMHEVALASLELESDLRKALRDTESHDSELSLHYQPIIEVATGQIKGFEALARWKHPSRGNIPPGEFIPLAEETGLILPLGIWALRASCRQMRAWQTKFVRTHELSISVNVSTHQLQQASFVSEVRQILRETELSPRSLCIEITESLLMQDPNAAVVLLHNLKTLGIRLHLDDFGTGYSSLSYLHRFPFDSLKIDRAFITRLSSGAKGAEMVRAILSLAQNLGLNVIAEGVEEDRQLQFLKDSQCGHAQGYLFSRPLPGDGAEKLLHASVLR